MTVGPHEVPDLPSAGDPPHYVFEIDPEAIHAGILRAHEERHKAVMAMLRGAARGVAQGAAWLVRQVTGAGHGSHGPGSPGALAR